MSRNAYIVEAFKQFNSLMEEEDTEKISREELPIYDANTENMSSFLDMVGDDDDIDVDVIDLEAEAEEDLKQSYVGKVILDCNVCHSNIFVNKDEVIVDGDGNANVDLECPYCMSNEGYTIIGQVEPYSEDTEEDVDIEEVPEETDEVDDIELEEGLITKDEWRKGYEDVYTDVAKGIVRDGEADFVTRQLDKELREEDDTTKDIDEHLISDWDAEDEIEWLRKQKANGNISEDEYKDKFNAIFRMIDESKKKSIDECDKVDIEESLDEVAPDLESEPIIEFENGDYFYVDYEDGMLIAGGVTNTGVIPEYEIEYDDTDSFDGNLERLYDEITSMNPELLGESFKYSNKSKHYATLKEQINRMERRIKGIKKLDESIENVSIDTEDETMTMTTKEDGGIMIETSPRESFDDFEDFDSSDVDDFEEESSDEFSSGDEVIAPISNESEDEIELNSEVETLSDEEIDDLEEPEDVSEFEDEVDISDFDEDSFNELGESYLRKHYDNVEGFRTVNVKAFNDSLIVEGVIRFNSGNSRGTQFVFEATKATKKAMVFEGYNKNISRGKKTFKMTCSLNKGMVTPQKLSYNYTTKNELNESVRVNGTCRVK